MKKPRWWWKAAAVIMCALVAFNTIYVVSRPHSPVGIVVEMSLVITAVGSLQYAFGWPRLPRLLWRIVGPLFSVAMLWPVASAIGTLGARLAIKALSGVEQSATIFLMALMAGYVLLIVVPLYRLGEWHQVGRREPAVSSELGELIQTFE